MAHKDSGVSSQRKCIVPQQSEVYVHTCIIGQLSVLFVASIHLHVHSTPYISLAVPSVQLCAIGHDALFFVRRWTMIDD